MEISTNICIILGNFLENVLTNEQTSLVPVLYLCGDNSMYIAGITVCFIIYQHVLVCFMLTGKRSRGKAGEGI